MSVPGKKAHKRPLGEGLVLCTAADEKDINGVASLMSTIHGPPTGTQIRNLFLHHPATHIEDLFFVKDEETARIVSSLCLIPWTWRYGPVELSSGELAIVATAEAYRRRGLVRAQVEAFKRRLDQRACLLSQIQGIPYFYRQFGYEYALPLEGGVRLELRRIPASPEPPFTFRRATVEDIPVLQSLYDQAAQDLTIHARRTKATWEFLETYAEGTMTERERWICTTAGGEIAGYVSVPRYHFGEELAVDETSQLSFGAALAALQHLKKLAVEREKPGIRLNLPAHATLSRLGRSLDGHDMGTYAWQIHVPNVANLLRALAPILELRIADSPFAGLTQEIELDLYGQRLVLSFQTGELARVAEINYDASRGERVLQCPPLQFIPLMLGHRTWQELHEAYPDVTVPPMWRLLVDTLFPKMRSFLYSPY